MRLLAGKEGGKPPTGAYLLLRGGAQGMFQTGADRYMSSSVVNNKKIGGVWPAEQKIYQRVAG